MANCHWQCGIANAFMASVNGTVIYEGAFRRMFNLDALRSDCDAVTALQLNYCMPVALPHAAWCVNHRLSFATCFDLPCVSSRMATLPTPNTAEHAMDLDHSDTVDQKPQLLPKPPNRRRRGNDSYCWKCQGSTNAEFDFICKQCGRSFHYLHSRRNNQTPAPQLSRYQLAPQNHCCPVCLHMIEASVQYAQSELPELNRAISIAIDKLKRADDKQSFYSPVDETIAHNYARLIVSPIDVSIIERKALHSYFASAEEFLYDFKQILHNSIIYNRPQSNLTRIAKVLYKLAFEEYCKISYCYQCYLKAVVNVEEFHQSDQFLVACNRPHGVVWAQKPNQLLTPFLPAKIINFCDVAKNGIVDVCFFGTREVVKGLKMEECFSLSKSAPNLEETTENQAETILEESISTDLKKYLDAVDEMRHSPITFECNETYAPDDTVLTFERLYLVKKVNFPVQCQYSFSEAKECATDDATVRPAREEIEQSSRPSQPASQQRHSEPSGSKKKKPTSPLSKKSATNFAPKQSTKRKQNSLNELVATTAAAPLQSRLPASATANTTASFSSSTTANLTTTTPYDQLFNTIGHMLGEINRENDEKLKLEGNKNQQLRAENQQLRAENQQLCAENQHLKTDNETYKSLLTNEGMLRSGLWCRVCLETSSEQLMCCCQNVFYCSQTCQHSDWVNHMGICSRIKREIID